MVSSLVVRGDDRGFAMAADAKISGGSVVRAALVDRWTLA
jgi:hypothetical protein